MVKPSDYADNMLQVFVWLLRKEAIYLNFGGFWETTQSPIRCVCQMSCPTEGIFSRFLSLSKGMLGSSAMRMTPLCPLIHILNIQTQN